MQVNRAFDLRIMNIIQHVQIAVEIRELKKSFFESRINASRIGFLHEPYSSESTLRSMQLQ